MKQQEFNLLDDETLIWVCVEPIVQKARGKDPGIKSQIIKQLNPGQQALFLFQVLHGHANHGILPFFNQISYLADRLDIWSALKSGMNYFNDMDMLRLIEKMEIAYYETTKQSENTIVLDELGRLYRQRIPLTLKRIGSYIRENSAEFIQLED